MNDTRALSIAKKYYRMRKKRFIIITTNYYFNNLEAKYEDVLKINFEAINLLHKDNLTVKM